ncbi:MAG: GTPase Era [Eubacterium coprostanoligenes]|uniref:GTPase Era n=1 Tax=Eubacterium coprostanoligenes TaxID=290054 RepID=A0A1T4N2L5_9FIRM|nr:GTPase Era [Eubacterium coprostanoligenes]MCI6361087.1 GTPase Era [Eubacterium coprostanoligenes]MDY4698918.1 GTPase Era [Eubacterium coprostanoligenes]MDY5376502.1 GTPase Era [Eubacterium coprostanoligenes]SJZ73523.1 GTP-binding protein Era [Eubacterium coprostanoligenes]
MTKTAFIAIVGCPNVGKSSILNKIMGTKIAIVSSKPQTTRTKIMGVLTEDDIQLVFTDTPGYHKPHNKLGEKMNQAVGDSIGGVDACLFVVESKGDIKKGEYELLEKFKNLKVPVILAINKIDMIKDKEELLERIVQLNSLFDFEAIVPVCASTGEHIDELVDEMKKLAFDSPHFFPDDTLTDQPERVLASEIIREKILRLMDKEVPHGIAVSIEKMRERDNQDILDIEAIIYCERESHKGMVIGKKGSMLKKISTYARQDLESFFGIKVNLQTWVKVKEDWRNREGLIHNFGLD